MSSTATISNPKNVNPTFRADLDGSYLIQLIVNNGLKDSEPAMVIITASSEGADIGSWQLAEEFRTGQKLPMRVIYPRPDNETISYALHRKASRNWAYQTRIAIQGGEAPFKYELITGPASASIGGEMTRTLDPDSSLVVHTLPDNYATVTWPEPTGNSDFLVKVTDQSGATVNVTWTVQTDESAFVVLDSANGDDNNIGTWASPLKTIATGLWKQSISDATFASKIAVFKKGTYPVYATVPNTNISLTENVKPRSFLAVDSDVIFDTRGGHFYVNSGDVAFVGIEFQGSRTDLPNNRIIQISTKNSNYLFWKLKFNNQTLGTVTGDNPSCIVFMDDTVFSHNIAVVDNTLMPETELTLINTFSSDGVLIENNKANNIQFDESNQSPIILVKDDTKNVTVRFNHLTGFVPGGIITMSNQQSPEMLALNQEVSFNYVKTSTVNWESGPILWNQNATSVSNAANTHSYRNTIISPTYAYSAASWLGGDDVKISGTAWIANNLVYHNGYEEISPANVKFSEGDLDSDGTINNSNGKKETYLGKVGFEIATPL